MALSFDKDQFRINFPEFADKTKYPDSMIDFQASFAAEFLNADRWGDRLIFGAYLYVAHNLVLQAQNVANSISGGIPGTGIGLASSQSVGPISESVDTQSTTIRDAGYWNLTSYGVQFYQIARIVGMGGAVLL